MLDIKGLSAGYGKLSVLRDISLEVRPGEIVAILGSNGAGKTTLFRSIFGFTDVTAGEVLFEGKDLRKLPAYEIARQGLVHVPEGRGLFPAMTVRENLLVPTFQARSDIRSATNDNLEYVLDTFPRLRDRLRQTVGTMSGGEQQMLAIGRGLMAEPRMLLLDEPSIGLAPKLVDEVFDQLRQVHVKNPEMGVLIVEQSVAETVALCDRGYVMEQGAIVLEGDSARLSDASALEDAFMGRAQKNDGK